MPSSDGQCARNPIRFTPFPLCLTIVNDHIHDSQSPDCRPHDPVASKRTRLVYASRRPLGSHPTELDKLLHTLRDLFVSHPSLPHPLHHRRRLAVPLLLRPYPALPILHRCRLKKPRPPPATAHPSSPTSAPPAMRRDLGGRAPGKRLAPPATRVFRAGLKHQAVDGLQLGLEQRVAHQQPLERGVVSQVGERGSRGARRGSGPVITCQVGRAGSDAGLGGGGLGVVVLLVRFVAWYGAAAGVSVGCDEGVR